MNDLGMGRTGMGGTGMQDVAMHHDRSTTERLLGRRWPVHAAASPDGSRLALTTTRLVRPTPDDAIVDLLVETELIDLASGAATALSPVELGDHSVVWSPDGSAVAFVSEVDGIDRVVVASPDGAGRRVLDAAALVAGVPVWSPDGTQLVVACRRGNAADRSKPFRWTRPIPAFDGLGPLDDPPQLRLVDVASGIGTWLTDDDWRWSVPMWSPAGDRLLAVVSIDPTGSTHGQRLRLVGLDGVAVEPPIPSGRTVVAAWSPDERAVVLVAEPRHRPGGSSAELYVLAGESVARIEIAGLDGYLLGDVYGDHPGELADAYERTLLALADGSLIVRTANGGRMGVARLQWTSDTTMVATMVAGGDRCVSPVAMAGTELVVTTQSAGQPVELAAIDLGTLTERRLADVDDEPTGPTIDVRRFVVDAPGGHRLDGWFLAPVDAPGEHGPQGAPRALPTVLMIHGGPHFSFGESYSLDAQSLCAAGFGVVYANPRGSTGYGDEFAHAVHGDWSAGPSSDVLAVVDHVVALGWADPARLGVTGNSYGGYLSAWLASTTDRFRAAVIENPVTDLVSMWATSDIGLRFFAAQFGGTPSERPEVYREQSPLLQAHRCRTPSLFVTGELDRRCPPAQTWAMHRVLCAAGTPSEVLVLPGSSHEGSTYGPPAGRLAHDHALVEWMARWLVP